MSKICKNCGNALRDEVKFCPKCGAKAEPVQVKADTKAHQPKKKTWLIAGIASAAVVAISVAVILVFFNSMKNKPESQGNVAVNITEVKDENVQETFSEDITGKTVEDKSEENKDADQTQTAETTAQTTKSRENKTSELLTATENDKNNFRKMLEQALGKDQFLIEYNNNSSSTKEVQMERAFLSEFGAKTYDNYFGTKSGTRINGKDPLGRFEEDDFYGTGYSYFKISKQEAEWIMKNIFNISSPLVTDFGPGKTTYDEEGYIVDYEMGNNDVYFYDGYYYYNHYFDLIGDGGSCVDSVNFTKMDDGKYKIDCKNLLGFEGDGLPYANMTIIAGLKSIDGKRTWTFYSATIDEFRTFD